MENWTEKLILYEQNPGRGDYTYLTQSFMMQSDEMQDGYMTAPGNQAQLVANYLPSSFNHTIWQENGSTGNGSDAYPTFPYGSDVISEMNSTNYALWSWFGHGSPTVITASSNEINTAPRSSVKPIYDSGNNGGLDQLTNSDYPAVVYSIGCTNTPFDDHETGVNERNLGETFTVINDGGGPAFLGNTRFGWLGPSHTLYQCFADKISLGGAYLHIGNAQLVSKNNFTHYIFLSHNLVGCPEMRLWTENPSEFTNVELEEIGHYVEVITGISDGEDCRITIMSLDGGVTEWQTVSNVTENRFATAKNKRPLYITIDKPGYLPYSTVFGKYSYDLTNITINNDVTFYGKMHIPDHLEIASGATLTIAAGAELVFENNAKLIVNGTLNINGTSANKVTFDFVNPHYSAKNSITFNSGSTGSLNNCIVKNGYYGVYCNGYLPSISNCTFTGNSYGAYVKNVGTTSNKILTCLFKDNNAGIYCYNGDPLIEDCKMTDNLYGTYVYANSSPKYYYNTISDNDRNGVRCYNSQPYFGYTHEIPFGTPKPGYNRITGNGNNGYSSNKYGLYSSNSSVFMGMDVAAQAMGGYNSIFGNNTYEVYAINGSTVSADWNFWNTYPSSPANVIYESSSSSVTYYSQLPTDPGGGSSLGKQNSSNHNPDIFDPKNVDMNNPKELQQLALFYKYTANYDESINVLEEIMDKFPETEYVTMAMNEIFDISKRSKKIDIESYCNDKISSSKSSNKVKQASYDVKIAKFLRDGKVIEAAALCSDLLKKYPNTSCEKRALLNLLLIYSDDEKKLDEASSYLNMLKEKFPNEEETLHAMEFSGEEVDWSKLKKLEKENQSESETSTEETIPDKYVLYPAYPNPFNPITTISFDLPEASKVNLEIYNVQGQMVWSSPKNNTEFSAGNHSVVWKGTNISGYSLPSGMYFIKFHAGVFTATQKLILIK